MDYSPQLFETGGNVYVTWQNANTVIDLTDDTELDDLLEYFDISGPHWGLPPVNFYKLFGGDFINI